MTSKKTDKLCKQLQDMGFSDLQIENLFQEEEEYYDDGSNLLEETEAAGDAILAVLETVTILNDQVLKQPVFKELKRAYDHGNNSGRRTRSVDKSVISILNSAITNGRMVFILTRNSIRKIIKEDSNWNGKRGFDNNSYSKLRAILLEKHVEIAYETEGSTKDEPYFTVFKITNPRILKYFQIDIDSQLEQAIKVADQMCENMKKTKQSGIRGVDGSYKKNETRQETRPGCRPKSEIENETDSNSDKISSCESLPLSEGSISHQTKPNYQFTPGVEISLEESNRQLVEEENKHLKHKTTSEQRNTT